MQVYKQKVKHLLYEHQNNITELKRDGAVAVTLEQSQHKEREGDLNQEKRTLKVRSYLCYLCEHVCSYHQLSCVPRSLPVCNTEKLNAAWE